ncbi:MAG: SPOR domain-containing protein [Bacteroidetes bacterium]|nr:SPOR domain-containing protein [Bacteroidota bacterium]MDA1143372.1 SPOR domain-containing protein [Bacteroidota bacterium]
MQLEKYISPLLFRYNCVVIPGFGAVLTHEKGASHHEKTHTFYPPTKVMSFNAQLHVGDGILVAHIAAVLSIKYEAALRLVKDQVQLWKSELASGNALSLEGLGVFTQNSEAKISFTPFHEYNYLPASFGLQAIKVVPKAPLKKTRQQTSEPVVFQLDQQYGSNHGGPWRKVLLRYAAAALIGVSGALSVYQSYNIHTENKRVAFQEATKEVEYKIQEATFFNSSPLSLSTLEISLAKKEIVKPSFFIIAGAFREPENASKRIAQLKRSGYEKATYLGPNRYGLHQVSFQSFVAESDARAFLKEVQAQFAKDAWLLVLKK